MAVLVFKTSGRGDELRRWVRLPRALGYSVLVSVPFRRDGWYPEVLASMAQMGAAAEPFLRDSPMYQGYAAIAPDPAQFPALLDKMGDLLRQDYDWSAEVAAMRTPTLLVCGDADSIPPAHMAEFFALLGGGKGDAGWDGSRMPTSRLAILPGTTHYTSFSSPLLADAVAPFLDATLPVAG